MGTMSFAGEALALFRKNLAFDNLRAEQRQIAQEACGDIYIVVPKQALDVALAEFDKLEAQLARAREIIKKQREALNYFLGDSRFQISVGGNPHAVEAMLAKARAA